MSARTDRTMEQDSLRNRIWRAVRDAGSAGLDMGRIQALMPDRWEKSSVRTCCNEMVRQRFMDRKGSRRGPYIVTEDCRVPVGEDPHLGPALDEAAPAVQPPPVPTVNAEPRQATAGTVSLVDSIMGRITSTDSLTSTTLALSLPASPASEVRLPAACAATPRFRCALDSDGALSIQSGSMSGTLGREEVRRLVEYLGRFEGFGVQP